MANNSSDNLRRVKKGDRPSAGQQNIIVARQKALAKSNGPGMTVTSDGMILIRDTPQRKVVATRLRIDSVEEDYLVCHSWDGTTEGTVAINVAKPWKLRFDKDNYQLLTEIAKVGSDTQKATATVSSDTETWVVTPSYEENDEIYAISGKTGVVVGGADVGLVDLNVDGRAWAVEA